MTDEDPGGHWDEDEGYSFREPERVELPSADDEDDQDQEGDATERVLIGGPDEGRMHPEFPEVHDYLQQSLKDLDLVSQDIWALRQEHTGDDDADDRQRFTIRKSDERPQRTISEDDTGSEAFRQQRLRRKAYRLVKRKLKAEGKSDEWIRDHRALIHERVDAFLGS